MTYMSNHPALVPDPKDIEEELAYYYTGRDEVSFVTIAPKTGDKKSVVRRHVFNTIADTIAAVIKANSAGENCYIELNPVAKGLKTKGAASATTALENIGLDVDAPKELEADIGGKKIYAWQKETIEALKAHNPQPTKIICSGYGIQAFWKLDKPTKLHGEFVDGKWKWSEESQARINEYTQALIYLIDKFGGDPACKNIDRIMRLGGTINYKAGRPNRLSGIREHFPSHTYSLDQFEKAPRKNIGKKALAANGMARSGSDDKTPTGDIDQKALVEMLPFVPCSTYDNYFAMVSGIHHATGGSEQGFEITEYRAKDETSYDAEQNRIIWDSLNSDRENPVTIGTLIAIARENGWKGSLYPQKVISEQKPRQAAIYLSREDAGKNQNYAHEMWIVFNSETNAYDHLSEQQVRRRITGWLATKQTNGKDAAGNPVLVDFQPRRAFVDNVYMNLIQMRERRSKSGFPYWRDGNKESKYPDPKHCVALLNCVVDMTTGKVVEGLDEGEFVTLFSIPCNYDPKALVPQKWVDYMIGENGLFPFDKDAFDFMQEATGYLIFPENFLQKIIAIIGSSRSGKSVYAAICIALIGGIENVHSTTPKNMASGFGLQNIPGKSFLLFSDLHEKISSEARGEFLQNIKRLSGNDVVTIPRKNRDDVTERLSISTLMIGNEIPDLGDKSNAFSRRIVGIEITGPAKDDSNPETNPHLEAELVAECLAGIFNWSMAGLQRLRERNKFTDTEGTRKFAEALRKGSNAPMATFLEVAIDIDAPETRDRDQNITVKTDVFDAYLKWHGKYFHGAQHQDERPLPENKFHGDFGAMLPDHVNKKYRTTVTQNDGTIDRPRAYRGLSIRGGYSFDAM